MIYSILSKVGTETHEAEREREGSRIMRYESKNRYEQERELLEVLADKVVRVVTLRPYRDGDDIVVESPVSGTSYRLVKSRKGRYYCPCEDCKARLNGQKAVEGPGVNLTGCCKHMVAAHLAGLVKYPVEVLGSWAFVVAFIRRTRELEDIRRDREEARVVENVRG